MTQDQKNKMKSIRKSLTNIYDAVQKHVETNDPKILALPDYGLILGSTTLLMEEEILKGTEEGKLISSFAKPQGPTQETEYNEKQIQGGSVVVPIKKTTTFH